MLAVSGDAVKLYFAVKTSFETIFQHVCRAIYQMFGFLAARLWNLKPDWNPDRTQP
jgi:hypothetical protein